MNERMKVKLQLITPAIAENYLRYNIRNRKATGRLIRFLSNQMIDNLFLENGESIVFDLRGDLVDGQHRLLAIIKSGKSYNIPVVTGVLPHSMATYDTGKNRSARDVLQMNGFKYYSPLASFIISLNRYFIRSYKNAEVSTGEREGMLTNQQVLEYCKDNYDWLKEIMSKSQYLTQTQITPKVLSGTQIALICYVIGGKQPDSIVYDFMKYIIGISRTADSATNYLFTKLYNSKINKEPLNFYWILGMSIKAYNYFIDGNPAVRFFRFSINDDLPKIKKL
jgi:hypothetical protein